MKKNTVLLLFLGLFFFIGTNDVNAQDIDEWDDGYSWEDDLNGDGFYDEFEQDFANATLQDDEIVVTATNDNNDECWECACDPVWCDNNNNENDNTSNDDFTSDDDCDTNYDPCLCDGDCGGDNNYTPEEIDQINDDLALEFNLPKKVKFSASLPADIPTKVQGIKVTVAPINFTISNLPTTTLNGIVAQYNAGNAGSTPLNPTDVQTQNNNNSITSQAVADFNQWVISNILLQLSANYYEVKIDNCNYEYICNNRFEENNDFESFDNSFFEEDHPWRFRNLLSPDSYYATGLLAGIGDGLVETVDLAYTLVKFQQSNTLQGFMTNLLVNFDGEVQRRVEQYQTVKALVDLINDAEKQAQILATIKKEMGDWFDQVALDKTLTEGGYQHGKLVFEIIGAFFGVAEAKALLKTGQFSATALNAIRKIDGAIALGNKFRTINGVPSIIDGTGKVLFELVDGVKKFKYLGFGGDIVATPNKTTTIIGKWNDLVDSGGTKQIIENGLSKSGDNIGGINALDIAEDITGMSDNEIWDLFNKGWLDDAIAREDIIRSISNPFDNTNLYKQDPLGNFINSSGDIIPESNLLDEGIKSFYGREVEYLQNAGYI